MSFASALAGMTALLRAVVTARMVYAIMLIRLQNRHFCAFQRRPPVVMRCALNRRSTHGRGTVRIALRNRPSSGAARTLRPFCSPRSARWTRIADGHNGLICSFLQNDVGATFSRQIRQGAARSAP
jgi:hypothetical protein